MPSRSRSPAPLGAFQTPKSVQHCAVGAQNLRRHPPKSPGKAAASLRTISAKIYIYMRGKSSRWGKRSVAPRQAIPRTSTRLVTHKHGGGDAKSPVTVVVAATAADAAIQSHPASILPNTTQGQRARPPRTNSANDTKHADAVSGEQNRIRDAKKRREKLRQDGRGGYSHPWRHPRPPGIDPAQQNEGLARQKPSRMWVRKSRTCEAK